MQSAYLVLALLVPGPVIFGLCLAVFKAAIRRQDGEEPGELSLVEVHRLNRSIEQIARENGNV